MPLTDAALRNAKPSAKPVKLTDGGGLYLEVRPSGAKLWRYRYRIAGKENVFAIGDYPAMTLAQARHERTNARDLVRKGVHPSRQRRADLLVAVTANANTFEAIAREWMSKKAGNWSPYYTRQVSRFMETDVFPHIGNMPIRAVTAAHLLTVIKAVEDRGAETVAGLLRQWSSAIFRYAVATLRADHDPAAALRGAIHRPKTKHCRPLTRVEIGALSNALDAFTGYPTTVSAMRLLLLTFVRTKELREAKWSEIDFERCEWRIPAQRMKMRDGHIVPLSRQVTALLHELHHLTGEGHFLFPNYRRPEACMTGTTLNRALERMGFAGTAGLGFSAHGFRATASTILNEFGFRPDVIERQLAHKERNKTRASYNQAEYLTERRAMMQQWADVIDQIAGREDNIVAFKQGKG